MAGNLIVECRIAESDRELMESISKKLDILIERGVLRDEAPDAEENYIILPDDPIPDEDELPFPEEKAEAEAEPEPEPEQEKQTVTMEAIRKKAVELSASGKKDEVRKVVNVYAKKVSEIPEDKWDEVWKKLVKLEG